MSRFRVWHKELNMMFEVKSLVFTLNLATIASKNDLVPSRTCSFDDIVLMQFTGLFDKNGKEIFEGDILKCTPFDGSLWYETVSWDSTLAGFATQQNGYDATAIRYITDSEAITVEIIGDIYQNQKLLEELK